MKFLELFVAGPIRLCPKQVIYGVQIICIKTVQFSGEEKNGDTLQTISQYATDYNYPYIFC